MANLVFCFTFYNRAFSGDMWFRNFLDYSVDINCYKGWCTNKLNETSRPVQLGFPWKVASVTQTYLDKEMQVWRV